MLEAYYIIKTLHVISATLLFTASYFTAIYVYKSKFLNNSVHLALRLNLALVIPLAFFQMLTGFAIIGIKHYPMHLLWVWSTGLGFFAFLMCQLVATFQLKLIQLNPAQSAGAEKRWKTTLIISLLVLLYMLFMMANTPGSPPA